MPVTTVLLLLLIAGVVLYMLRDNIEPKIAKLIVLIIIVLVAFWLLERFGVTHR